MKIFGYEWKKSPAPAPVVSASLDTLSPDFVPLASSGYGQAPAQTNWYDGDKFPGGFGVTQLYALDYWTLRERSAQIFQDNLYARGLIRRLITNEINTGLAPEACPEDEILGISEEDANKWSETIETRFSIWAKNEKLCDWEQQRTFGAVQRQARMEALISGDVLCYLRVDPKTRLPRVQLIDGRRVQSPLESDQLVRKGHTVKHGVELNAAGRVVAHWIRQDEAESDDIFKRIPAWGERTGRRMSWLVYGTERRLDDVRGEPLLSIILQSLKEIDRYRDSATRKAVVNSILAMFVKKGEKAIGSLPISGGAVRKDTVQIDEADGSSRNLDIVGMIPGAVAQELQAGEDIVTKGGEGTDINFGAFEESIIQAVAWANEIPPEILRLSFSNNYSASQAALNEFKIYINLRWTDWGETFCTPIYIEWLIAEALTQRVKTPGLLEAWADPLQYDTFGAFTAVEWYGSIKLSTDMVKQTKASENLINLGLSTYAREARVTTGTKFSKNVKRQKKEREQLAEAMRPTMEFAAEFSNQTEEPDPAAMAFEDMLTEALEERNLLDV